jgi:hypothetical protein
LAAANAGTGQAFDEVIVFRWVLTEADMPTNE